MTLGRIGTIGLLAASMSVSGYVKWDLSREKTDPDALQNGDEAPDFVLEDLDGDSQSLDEIAARSDLVLVNFWATWCGPCRMEMPQFERMHKDPARKGLEIVAVNVGEDPERVREYLDENPVSFTVLLDPDGEIFELYRCDAFPTSFLIDERRRIQMTHVGIDPYLDMRVRGLLASMKRAPGQEDVRVEVPEDEEAAQNPAERNVESIDG